MIAKNDKQTSKKKNDKNGNINGNEQQRTAL